MSWYHCITYSISHLGKQARITAQQGLRQGCQLAPLLWAMAVGCIVRAVAHSSASIPPTWLQDNMTTYADDIHLKACCRSVAQLDRALHYFGLVLDALTRHDMVVNTTKSAILLRYKGHFLKTWLRRHRVAVKDGHVLRFRSPQGQEYQIPIQDKHTYLGVSLSYQDMSKQTVSHRLQVANQAWQRLRKILYAPRQLELNKRLTLWRATILPTLMYGLAAVAPSAKDTQRIQAMIIKHLRAMTHSFAHMQHESTKHLHERCNIPTATARLLKEATAFLARLRLLQAEVPFISSEQLESTRTYAASLQAQWTQPEPTGCSEAAYQCSDCNRAFDSFRLLRSHEASMAKRHQQPPDSGNGTASSSTFSGRDVRNSEASPLHLPPLFLRTLRPPRL